MVETLRAHRVISDKEARGLALDKLREVAVPSPETRLASYPHELSGGLRRATLMRERPLIEIEALYKQFALPAHFLRRRKPVLHALNGVSLAVGRGESLCVVGESGCGKTTLGRIIMGLIAPTSGAVRYDGVRIDTLSEAERRPYRRRMQTIFQNPYGSLNPRMTVQQTLEEPLRFHRPELSDAAVRDHVEAVMVSVGNDPRWGRRLPHEFSGGQRQRISIARALVTDPEFLVADEPVSALDVSVQAQVLNVLLDARDGSTDVLPSVRA